MLLSILEGSVQDCTANTTQPLTKTTHQKLVLVISKPKCVETCKHTLVPYGHAFALHCCADKFVSENRLNSEKMWSSESIYIYRTNI